MTHQASPFESIDPPESREATARRAYEARKPHAPDPELWPEPVPVCGECGCPCELVAFLDSDGWALSWDHCDERWGDIPWLFGDRSAGPKDLVPLGFSIV